jgi:methylaspartate mutase sigma subunit
MPKSALLATIPSDSHSWNLVFMQMFLKEQGFQVLNLGICVPMEDVLRACQEHRPELVVISTVNGHGYLEGVELARRFDRLDIRRDFKLVIGGKLGIRQSRERLRASELLSAGYDGVFHGSGALRSFLDFLRRELGSPVILVDRAMPALWAGGDDRSL